MLENDLIAILNLIAEGKYPYPQHCKQVTGNTITLFCLENGGLFHKEGYSYVSNEDKLITIKKGEYIR
jgi:hypothetical protein